MTTTHHFDDDGGKKKALDICRVELRNRALSVRLITYMTKTRGDITSFASHWHSVFVYTSVIVLFYVFKSNDMVCLFYYYILFYPTCFGSSEPSSRRTRGNHA
jgi:hypothetical protein